MPQLPSHMARAAKEFSTIRRQQFMYWEAYEAILQFLNDGEAETAAWMSVAKPSKKLGLGWVAALHACLDDKLNRISLEYTAGAPREELKALYPAAVDAFEAWVKAHDAWGKHARPEKK